LISPVAIRLTSVTLNSPKPSALAQFYARLLGWTVTVDEPDWVELPNPAGGIGLSFHIEDIHVPPVWPAEPGEQQMQAHLEIQVDDLETGAAHAQACGATLAEFQPQDNVRVHLDPDGHPFCIYVSSGDS
jgi:catechol 2,3-dioxygenase-like lactoylglutathione lyase family enzyme